MNQIPTVGRTVHYRYRPKDEPLAAIITKVHDATWVSLIIFSPDSGTRLASHVEYNVGWFWPPQAPTISPVTDDSFYGTIFP